MTDQKQLGTSDQAHLQSGDDLALEALSRAGGGAASGSQVESEAAESDQLAETVVSLQNIIERNANQLDEVKTKMKSHCDQLRSVFENDIQLGEAEQQLDTFSRQVKDRKSQLQADPTVTRLKVEIGELSQRKKELEEALSNHLVNYYQLTNSKSFDTSDGDQREFTIRASVKSKRP